MTPCDQVVEYLRSTDTATARQIAEHFGWPVGRAQYAVWASMNLGLVDRVGTIRQRIPTRRNEHGAATVSTAIYGAKLWREK